MHYLDAIKRYLAGAEQVRDGLAGMTEEQFDARPIPDQWSTRQVVCHLADFDLIYADRMKRVIVEQCPTFFGGDPDAFAARLDYQRRSVAEELALLVAVRQQMATILRGLNASDFQRTGKHSEAGLMTLETLLQRITNHVPHHLAFIAAKRAALGI